MDDDRSLKALDADLRRTLEPIGGRAPLPPGVLDVPDSWVRPRAQLAGTALRASALVAVVVGGFFVATTLPAWLGRVTSEAGGPPTIEAAAQRVGVPPSQVFSSADGFVAIRRAASGDLLELLLVPAGWDSGQLLLATARIDPSGRALGNVSLDVFHVSCVADASLHEPDFVFGASHFNDVFPDIAITATADGVMADGLFAYVVVPGSAPDGVMSVLATSTQRRNVTGQTDILSTAFDHLDQCVGEEAHRHD